MRLTGEAAVERDVQQLATASDALRFEVARHGALLFEAEPHAWAEFQAKAALMYFDLKPIIERCAEGVRARLRSEAGS